MCITCITSENIIAPVDYYEVCVADAWDRLQVFRIACQYVLDLAHTLSVCPRDLSNVPKICIFGKYSQNSYTGKNSYPITSASTSLFR